MLGGKLGVVEHGDAMDDADVQAVLAVNERFYEAFGGLDITRMAGVWVRDSSVRCVHPGWGLLRGWEDVMRSWERIFDNTTMMRFTITGTEATVDGNTAWVVCTENITSVLDGRVSEGKVQATNIYRRTQSGEWRMAHHHGSPIM